MTNDQHCLLLVEVERGAEGSTGWTLRVYSQIRLGVIQLLARWIASAQNCPSVRAAATDAEVLLQVAGIVASAAPPDSSDGGGALSSAEQAVLSGGLSADERETVLSGQPVTAGIGAVFVHDAQRLLAVAASVAAMSAEALQAQVPTAVPSQRCATLLSCPARASHDYAAATASKEAAEVVEMTVRVGAQFLLKWGKHSLHVLR